MYLNCPDSGHSEHLCPPSGGQMQTPTEPLGTAAAGDLLKIDARVTEDAYLLEVGGELDRRHPRIASRRRRAE